ncbi:succinate dehydrogenase subunit 7B, mitochondrial-like [Rutidosis leptorrhynchoides]|uniref:succinate dehydrogenase subunit 7B, mitochondrial-like n=1 Tax=Rutidosis leptorrhynchoides TaxID=125765 RepID=UPI003A99D068
MASLLKRNSFSIFPSHRHSQPAKCLPLQSTRQIHAAPGAREKALLAKDPALERFKSYRKSASSIRRIGDYLTIVVVAGCCYEIYVRAVTREEARKALKSN